MRPRSRMSARRLIEESTSSAVSRSDAGAATGAGVPSCPPATSSSCSYLRVEQRLLEAVRVGQVPDLVRAGLGRGQQVDLAVAEDAADPRVADQHVGDHRERGVARPLVDHAARLDHAARRDEVALPPPLEVVPADPGEPDQEEDAEAPARGSCSGTRTSRRSAPARPRRRSRRRRRRRAGTNGRPGRT